MILHRLTCWLRATLCIVLVLTPLRVAAQPDGENAEIKLIAFSLRGANIDSTLLQKLNDAMQLKLMAYPGIAVTSQAELALILEQTADIQDQACEGQIGCLVDLTENMQAEKILSGSVGRIGESLIINLQLIDAPNAAVIARASETVYQETEAIDALGRGLDTLFLPERERAEQPTFKLEITAGRNRFAVLDLQAAGVDEGVAKNLTEVLTVEMKRYEGLEVISRQEIRTMLEFEQQKQLLGCTDSSCFAEIGNALGVNYLTVGTVGKLDEVFVINLKLLDMLKGDTLHRVTESYQGAAGQLVPAMRYAVAKLLGGDEDQEGRLRLKVSEEGAQVFLDGENVGEYPELRLGPIRPGKVGVAVEAQDYFPYYEEVYIQPGSATDLNIELLAKPTPWYKTWWFWTITGAVIIGAATTTTVLLLQDRGGRSNGAVEISNPLSGP